MQWWAQQRQPSRVRPSELIFDPMADLLVTSSGRVRLMAMASRLLRRLYAAREAGERWPLTARRLAAELGPATLASAVGNHVHAPRDKMQSVLGHPRLIFHDRDRGNYLAPPSSEPPGR